jgi:glycosyltransferase involved in cell wall biosynthesis
MVVLNFQRSAREYRISIIMFKKKPHLCFVGNMLGRNAGYITSQGQIVADLFAEEGYKVTCVSSKINRVKRLAEIVWTLTKKSQNIDVVLLETFSGPSFVIADFAGFFCKILKLPLIMVLHGGNLPKFLQKYPRWTKRVLRRADTLIAPSEFIAEKFNLPGYRAEVIPNVIELDKYPYRERGEILPQLIWMRSFHPIYNPEMAIKVLAELQKTEPKATLTMAGADKGLGDKIKNLAEEMGLSGSVRFAGFLDLEKKIKEFSDADIYINTNRVDNMPVSVVEARALGLPVVATNVGGLPYLIEHGHNGLLVPSEDVHAMVKNIKELLDNSELTRKISRSGRIRAEHSAWTAVRQDWEKLIEEVLKRKSTTTIDSRSFGNKFKAGKIKNQS